MILISTFEIFAQAEPVMYLCERYDDFDGEVGIGSIFSKGPVAIIIRCDFALNLDQVTIQYDKYDFSESKFVYYKKAKFDVDENASYLSFIMDDEKNMEFEEPGFYRVFLLDSGGETVASAVVEIIN